MPSTAPESEDFRTSSSPSGAEYSFCDNITFTVSIVVLATKRTRPRTHTCSTHGHQLHSLRQDLHPEGYKQRYTLLEHHTFVDAYAGVRWRKRAVSGHSNA